VLGCVDLGLLRDLEGGLELGTASCCDAWSQLMPHYLIDSKVLVEILLVLNEASSATAVIRMMLDAVINILISRLVAHS
jgi:hypothetical protein